MPAIVTFDPEALRIIEISAAGDNELDVSEVYSEWKEWMLIGDNSKYPPAMRFVGGDPISDVQNLGVTYFLTNGWKIRPAELSHKLTLVGNIFTDPAGESVFVPTEGAFTVNTETRVSNLVDSSVSRLDLTQLLTEVYIDTATGVPGTGAGVGTPTNPVNNVIDARTIADRDHLTAYAFHGNITVAADHTRWSFRGISASDSDTIDLSGVDVDQSIFESCSIQGAMTGSIEAKQCHLAVLSGLAGTFRDCGFEESFSIADGATTAFHSCFSLVAGAGTPECHMGDNCSAGFRDYSGGLEVFDLATGSMVSVDLDPGHLIVGPTNTGGDVLVRGIGRITNTSSLDIIDAGFVSADATSESHIAVAYDGAVLEIGVWADRRGESLLDPTSATVAWYQSNGLLLFSETSNLPDSNGHFRFARNETLTANEAYYAILTVSDAEGAIITRRAVPTVG